jgi:LacI family transcriptional regulator
MRARTRASNRRRRAGSNAIVLSDVARAAGVSTASVSRALNTPELVSEDVRVAVQAAVTRLGYIRHSAARALASRRSMTIGAVVPTIAYSIFSAGVEAIERRLEEAGYALLIATSDYSLERELRQARVLLERGVDGLILVGRYHRPELARMLQERAIPYVCQGAYEAEGPPCVGFDNHAAMASMAEHVLGLGHRRIAMLAGIAADNDRVIDRIAGARAALNRAGLDFVPGGLVESRYDVAEARLAMKRLLALRPRPTAVLCVNDVLALGALFEARAKGVTVPAELSITGFDDFDFARNVEPPLTTLRVPAPEMGRGAAEQLLQRLMGQSPPQATLLPTTIIPRGTTGPAPAG